MFRSIQVIPGVSENVSIRTLEWPSRYLRDVFFSSSLKSCLNIRAVCFCTARDFNLQQSSSDDDTSSDGFWHRLILIHSCKPGFIIILMIETCMTFLLPFSVVLILVDSYDSANNLLWRQFVDNFFPAHLKI